MTFESLKLIDPLQRALKDLNYTEPTAIQERAIPPILQRKDVLGSAQTGTGKTAAFALPILQLIEQVEVRKQAPITIRALILTPTRELAIQINDNIKAYGKYSGVKHTAIFGGVKQAKQVQVLRRGVHLLVATPGRLLDLIDQGLLSLDTVKLFVLDEADKMLDMGFIRDIRKIINLLPKKRQSLFFSATMPLSIVELSREILRQPVKVAVDPVSSAAETVEQFVYYTNRSHKMELLMHLLKERQIDQVLLFARTKRGADTIARKLKRHNIRAQAIHGDKSQNQRQDSLQLFKDSRMQVLVATDIAARGIDIPKLRYVVNYDVPNLAEDYVHRIGRSGRAGEVGTAISFCDAEELTFVKDIEQLISQKLQVVANHPFPLTDKPMTAAEKKEWNKEKQRRKQEFFAKRKERGPGVRQR